MKTLPAPAPGQRWAMLDRYGDWRYATVESVDDTNVIVRGGRGRGRRRPYRLARWGGNGRLTYCGHDGPGILPPYTTHDGVTLGCANCGHKPAILPLDAHIAPGFGWTTVTRDGAPIWNTSTWSEKRLAHIELWARETPGDWRLNIQTPLSETLYQRQDAGWVLVAIGMGFA